MNVKIFAFSALLLAAGLGCSSSSSSAPAGTKGSYTLNLSGFSPHVSQPILLKLKDASGATIGSAMTSIAADGSAKLTVANVLDEGTTYHADFFSDTKMTGGYVPPTGAAPNQVFPDHSWRRTVTGKSVGVQDSFTHDANWVDLSPF